MQIPVLVEKVEGNGYRAREVWPLSEGGFFAAEGATREEALDKLRELIQSRLPDGAELTNLDLGAAAEIQALRKEISNLREQINSMTTNPWERIQGIFKDDPMFDEWQAAIAEYRRQVDEDPNIR
jgi:hypothetical protein